MSDWEKADKQTVAYREVVEAGHEALDWLLPAEPGSSRYAAWDNLRKALEHYAQEPPG